MTGKRKDRLGFSMIELLVVIAVIAVLAAIGIFGMSDSRNRYECERTAGAVRDFLVEGMAHASKISRDVPIAFNFNRENRSGELACMELGDDENHIVLWSTPRAAGENGAAGGNPVARNILLGAGEGLVDDIRLYSFNPGEPNNRNNLFDQNGKVDNQNLTDIDPGAGNGFLLRAKGPAIMIEGGVRDARGYNPILLVQKGSYRILMRIGGNGNVNMYLAKGDSDAGIETLQFNAIK